MSHPENIVDAMESCWAPMTAAEYCGRIQATAGLSKEDIETIINTLPVKPQNRVSGKKGEEKGYVDLVIEAFKVRPEHPLILERGKATPFVTSKGALGAIVSQPPSELLARPISDLKSITWVEFLSMAVSLDLLALVATCAFNGYDPYDARLTMNNKGSVTLKMVLQVLAAWSGASLKEGKGMRKRTEAGRSKMDECRKAVLSIGIGKEMSVSRFFSSFPDAQLYFRCFLVNKGELNSLVSQENVTFALPAGISFLGFPSIYDTRYWSTEFAALSRFLNPTMTPNRTIEAMIEKRRADWNSNIVPLAKISETLRGGYKINDGSCAIHKLNGEIVDKKWGIFAHDMAACGTCIFNAMQKEKTLTSDPGLSGKKVRFE